MTRRLPHTTELYAYVEKAFTVPNVFVIIPKNRKKALKADRQLRTIAGRLVRELERNLEGKKGYENMFELYYRVLSQNRKSKEQSIFSARTRCSLQSAKVRNISNMSLAIKYLFFAHGQDL